MHYKFKNLAFIYFFKRLFADEVSIMYLKKSCFKAIFDNLLKIDLRLFYYGSLDKKKNSDISNNRSITLNYTNDKIVTFINNFSNTFFLSRCGFWGKM